MINARFYAYGLMVQRKLSEFYIDNKQFVALLSF